MFLYVRNVLISVRNIYHVRKVSHYIPLSVNTSTTLVHISHNVRHVQHVLISSMFLCHKILVAILFNKFSINQSAKAISVCNTFSIIALFSLIYVIFHMKNGEG